MGIPVVLNISSLSVKDKIDMDGGWQEYAFNRYVSDLISVNRSLPDFRHRE